MIELVRVKDPATGHEYTTGREQAEAVGLTILPDKVSTDVSYGHALPPKYATDKSGKATNAKAAN